MRSRADGLPGCAWNRSAEGAVTQLQVLPSFPPLRGTATFPSLGPRGYCGAPLAERARDGSTAAGLRDPGVALPRPRQSLGRLRAARADSSLQETPVISSHPSPAPLPSLLPRIRQHRFCSKTFGDFWSGVAILTRDCPRWTRGAAGPSPPAPSLVRPGGPPRPVTTPRPAGSGVPNRLRPYTHDWRQGRHFNGTRRNGGSSPQCPASSGRLGTPVPRPKSSRCIRRASPRSPPSGRESSGTTRLVRSLHGLSPGLRLPQMSPRV